MGIFTTEPTACRFGGPFPEIRESLTKKETWVFLFGFFAVLVIGIRWPSVWEFSALSFFPVGAVGYGVISSGEIRKPTMLRTLILIVVFHSLLFAGLLSIQNKLPKILARDFGAYVFIVIEVVVIEAMLRSNRRKTNSNMQIQEK